VVYFTTKEPRDRRPAKFVPSRRARAHTYLPKWVWALARQDGLTSSRFCPLFGLEGELTLEIRFSIGWILVY
jgi:hypothetical protein